MSFRTSKDARVAPNVSTNATLGLDWVARVLYERSFVLATATGLGAIFSLLYLLTATPQYVATTRILIEDQRPQIASGQEIVRMTQLDASVTMFSQVIDSQIALIQSQQQIEKVIDQLNLFEQPDSRDGPSIFKKLVGPLTTFAQPDSSGGPSIFGKFFAPVNTIEPAGSADSQSAGKMGELKRRDDQLRKFSRQLNVTRLAQTAIILVSYADPDRDRAAQVANAVAKAYIAQQAETINDVKRKAVGWLAARAAELQEEVLAGEQKIEEYKVRNGLISVDGRPLLERELIATLEQLIATRAEAAGAEARAKLFGEGRSDAEVAKLRASIQEKDLQRVIDKLASATDGMVGLRELELKHKATHDVYAGVLNRLKEGEVQASLQITQSRIVNYATPPLRPEWPRKALVLILGSLGSAWLATSFVLLQEFHLGIVRTPRDISQQLRHIVSLPIVGAGPSRIWRKKIGMAPGRRGLKKLLDQLLPTRSKRVKPIGIKRQASGDMASPYAQAMFTLINAMDQAQHTKGGGIFAFVSAQEGEGKTMTLLNLADYAASAGKKVLLIDADLRHPDLTETCAPLPVLSLLDIAEQKVDAAEVIINGTFNLCPGPHGHTCQRPMEILASDGVARLLREARADYDIVLIDTSPLLVYVDAKALMEKVDGIILLIECFRTTRAQIDEVLESLGEHCRKLLGFALNKSHRRHYKNGSRGGRYS